MLWVGTSGWQYADWRGPFYPPALGQPGWLPHFARHFATVELNVTFYRLPKPATFARWRELTPAHFRFAVKMSRYLTHVRRLTDPAEPVARFLDAAAPLGDKLGPVLVQLPPTMTAEPDRLAATLREFPAGVDVVVEPRHPSWWSPAVREVLTEHHASLCWADRRGRPVTPLWRTGRVGYLRLHEGAASPWPRYGRRASLKWLDRFDHEFTDAEDRYVYFNNDQHAAAVADAAALTTLARRHGLTVAPTEVSTGSR